MTSFIVNQSRKNQRLHKDTTFKGRNVQDKHGSLVSNYLEDIDRCIDQSLKEYSCVFVLRIDLKIPSAEIPIQQDRLMERFVASLSAKIKYHQLRANACQKRTHPTKVRYVWCKEISTSNSTHYHFALMLNKQSYWRVGNYCYDEDNLYTLIINAWLSALGLSPNPKYQYLVHFTENGEYIMRRDDEQSIRDVFYRLSYLCKLDTKPHDAYQHNFGSSRS